MEFDRVSIYEPNSNIEGATGGENAEFFLVNFCQGGSLIQQIHHSADTFDESLRQLSLFYWRVLLGSINKRGDMAVAPPGEQFLRFVRRGEPSVNGAFMVLD